MRMSSLEAKDYNANQKKRYNEGQYNVCGILVDVIPENIDDVSKEIESLQGCQIIKVEAIGKMALTVEDTEEFSSYEYINRLQYIPGVLSVSLISHYFG